MSAPANIDGDDTAEDGAKEGKTRVEREIRQTMSFASNRVKDITETFAAAARRLPPGRLVKDELFTLFESVGALEIMDPKMDSGYIPEGDELDPEFDVCKPLLPKEVLWIMDELLRLTIIWHDGYPLSQTIFTSLHIDQLISPSNSAPYFLASKGQSFEEDQGGRLVHSVLRAFCIGLIKICAQVLSVIQSQNYYEEEDFVTHLFGRELLPKCSAVDAIRHVQRGMDWLEQSDLHIDLKHALDVRLRFISMHLVLLVDPTEYEWVQLGEVVNELYETHGHVTACPDAFSDKVQRQLATSTPPRPMPAVTFDEAYEKWVTLINEVIEAKRLTEPAICMNPHTLQRATWAFADWAPEPGTFTRAYMQHLLFGAEHITFGVTFFDLLLIDLRDTVFGGHPSAQPESFQIEAPSDPRHKTSRILEHFMDKAFDEYLNLYRMVCQNRCRIRRNFTQAITIFVKIETEAKKADERFDRVDPHPELRFVVGVDKTSQLGYLASWTRLQTLQLMCWSIQLGFETEIYLPDELCMMYWLLRALERRKRMLLKFLQSRINKQVRAATAQKTFREAHVSAAIAGSRVFLDSLDLRYEAVEAMAEALFFLTGLLGKMEVVVPPKREYAADPARLYEARLKPFLSIENDPIPSLVDFQQDVCAFDVPVVETCNTINKQVHRAKSCLKNLKSMGAAEARYQGTEDQWKEELKQLETTCVAIAVQSSQLLRLAEKRGMEKVEGSPSLRGVAEAASVPPEGRYHKWWDVLILKEVK